MTKKFSSGKYAYFICDRSGFRYPYNEAVKEPGTGLLVHVSESDGEWSLVKHAQNFPPKKMGDAIALQNPRPNRREDTEERIPVLLADDGLEPLTTNFGLDILCLRLTISP